MCPIFIPMGPYYTDRYGGSAARRRRDTWKEKRNRALDVAFVLISIVFSLGVVALAGFAIYYAVKPKSASSATIQPPQFLVDRLKRSVEEYGAVPWGAIGAVAILAIALGFAYIALGFYRERVKPVVSWIGNTLGPPVGRMTRGVGRALGAGVFTREEIMVLIGASRGKDGEARNKKGLVITEDELTRLIDKFTSAFRNLTAEEREFTEPYFRAFLRARDMTKFQIGEGATVQDMERAAKELATYMKTGDWKSLSFTTTFVLRHVMTWDQGDSLFQVTNKKSPVARALGRLTKKTNGPGEDARRQWFVSQNFGAPSGLGELRNFLKKFGYIVHKFGKSQSGTGGMLAPALETGSFLEGVEREQLNLARLRAFFQSRVPKVVITGDMEQRLQTVALALSKNSEGSNGFVYRGLKYVAGRLADKTRV